MQYILDDKHKVDLDSLRIVRTLTNKVGITGKTKSGEHFNAVDQDGVGYYLQVLVITYSLKNLLHTL